MSMLVHVVKPSGTRFEFTFPDNTPADKILSELSRVKRNFGYTKTLEKEFKLPDGSVVPGTSIVHEDPKSGFAFDQADCVVCVVEPDDEGGVREIKRLKGAPPKPPAPGGG